MHIPRLPHKGHKSVRQNILRGRGGRIKPGDGAGNPIGVYG